MTGTPNPPTPDPDEPAGARPDPLTPGDPLRDEPAESEGPAAEAGASREADEEPAAEAGASREAGEDAAAEAGASREADEDAAAGERDPIDEELERLRNEPPPEPAPARTGRAGAGDPLQNEPDRLGGEPDPLRDEPERPAAAALAPPVEPRRLTRSSSDRMLGGVAGGLGRYFDVDPLLFRIAFVVLTFAGGFGVLAYLIGVAAIPNDRDPRPQRFGLARTIGIGLLAAAALATLTPNWLWGPELPGLVACGVVIYLLLRVIRDEGGGHVAQVAARVALVIALIALAAGGFTAAAAGSALGGGIIIAGTIIALGVALVGGAFRGGARWLIVPAFVLALPLGVVSAADLELEGDWGERTFRPATVSRVVDGYEMGVGHMQVDLRDIDFPEGRTELPVRLGVGELEVAVPADVCVTYDVNVGAGQVTTLDGIDDGGLDLDVEGAAAVPAGVSQLHVDADLGMGHVLIGPTFTSDGFQAWRDFEPGPLAARTQNTACEVTA
jgi:phage shock protein PspC (stress-responsive transcriptional regulator)